jgi:hypothetical protein
VIVRGRGGCVSGVRVDRREAQKQRRTGRSMETHAFRAAGYSGQTKRKAEAGGRSRSVAGRGRSGAPQFIFIPRELGL